MACRPLFSAPHLVASREQTSRLRRVLDRGQRSERRAAACAWNWRGLVWGRFGRRAEAAEEEEGAAAAAMNAIELSSEAAERQGEGWVQLARAGARRSRHPGEQRCRPHEFRRKHRKIKKKMCFVSLSHTRS